MTQRTRRHRSGSCGSRVARRLLSECSIAGDVPRQREPKDGRGPRHERAVSGATLVRIFKEGKWDSQECARGRRRGACHRSCLLAGDVPHSWTARPSMPSRSGRSLSCRANTWITCKGRGFEPGRTLSGASTCSRACSFYEVVNPYPNPAGAGTTLVLAAGMLAQEEAQLLRSGR